FLPVSPLTPTRSSDLLRSCGEDPTQPGDRIAKQFWGDIFAKLPHNSEQFLTQHRYGVYYREKAFMVGAMRTVRLILLAVLTTTWAAGCSSTSMPSLPWSGSTKADPTAEALYDEGTQYFADKRYLRAIDVLTKLKTDYPFSPQLTDAELK